MALFSRYLTTLEVAVNAFYNHHQDNIRFSYRCLDRILLNGLIQPFQQPERVVGFFNTYRHLYPVSRDVLRNIAGQFQNWVKNRSESWGAPHSGSSPRTARRLRRALLSKSKTRPSRRYPESAGTGAYPDCHRKQEAQSLAPANRPTLGDAVQLLRERSKLGPHVRPLVSLLPLLSARLPESTSLVGASDVHAFSIWEI
jgi:hypothetical protein